MQVNPVLAPVLPVDDELEKPERRKRRYVANLAFGAMSQTLVQIHAPPAIRGRVIGLYGTSFNGMRAFSGVTVGMGGSLVGVHWSLALSAVVLAIITAGLYVLDQRSGAPQR